MALSSRQCSSPASNLVRSIYAGPFYEETPPAQKRLLSLPSQQGNGRGFTADTAVAHVGWHMSEVALSSRQCSSPASNLVRSIYAGPFYEETPPAQKRLLSLPSQQGNGRGFTADTAVAHVGWHMSGGTVVSTVFFPCVEPCTFDLRGTIPRRVSPSAETSLVAPKPTRKRTRIHSRHGPRTCRVPHVGWHCRLDSVLPLRRTLLVRFTRNRSTKRLLQRRNVSCRSQANKEADEDSLPTRPCHMSGGTLQYAAEEDSHPTASSGYPATSFFRSTMASARKWRRRRRAGCGSWAAVSMARA